MRNLRGSPTLKISDPRGPHFRQYALAVSALRIKGTHDTAAQEIRSRTDGDRYLQRELFHYVHLRIVIARKHL
jgi:hypothetical protein